MKNLLLVTACFFGFCAEEPSVKQFDNQFDQASIAHIEPTAGLERDLHAPFNNDTISGNYLAGRFAQQHHDWGHASGFMDTLLAHSPDDIQLIKRAMVVAMGSGETAKAINLAHQLLDVETNSSLALLFLAADSFKNEQYEAAAEYLKRVPENNASDFVIPILKSWADAAQGKYDSQNLVDSAVHIYHAVVIADFMDEHKHIENMLSAALASEGMAPGDIERIADIYAHIGQKEKALSLHKKLLEASPNNFELKEKIARIERGEDMELFDTAGSAPEGVALAFYDMAKSLFQEYSDDSARVFAHMAVYLKPDLTRAHQLLAEVAARHGRHNEAIAYYNSILPESDKYIPARRRAAELFEEAGQKERAIAELTKLVEQYNDLESMIQIGDIYRRSENFLQAIDYYNQAAAAFEDGIPAEYWHLHYVRGMCYERAGQWPKAEEDLKTALAYQPDHPFVLNYLGYAWADQNRNLDEALEMIRKAVSLRPSDGYITDSLGWVLYRLGKHDEAVPYLEKAVELLPYDPVINDHLGDAYWRTGRKLEAKFQWARAKGHSEDMEMIGQIEKKLASGIPEVDSVRQAATLPQQDDKNLINR